MGKLKRTIKLARFCPPKNEGCSTIYDKIGAIQKTIKWYDEMTHYIPNEEKIDQVVSDTVEWIKI